MPNNTMASREMAAEIGSKRKHSDAAEAARDAHDEEVSIDAVAQPTLALAQSAPSKKPREEPSQSPSLPDGSHGLEEEKPKENGQDGKEDGVEDEDEDPAWILMRALEREIEESTSNTAASASFPVATAIPEDDDYDESDDDN